MPEANLTSTAFDLGAWYGSRRFAILLGILVVLLVGPPILFGFGQSGIVLDVLTSLLMFAVIVPLCMEPRQRLFALVLGIPTIFLALGGYAFPDSVRAGFALAGALCEALFLFGATFLVIRALFTTRPLTADSLCGAVCGYLFLGVAWSVLYTLVEEFNPMSFQVSPRLATPTEPARPLPHVLTYYSFITLTTVGYGDVSPVTPTARTLAWVEALTGQFYVGVVVAGLVSVLATRGEGGNKPRE